MDWPFLVLLAVAVPLIFLPPAFLLLRPTLRNGGRSKEWLHNPSAQFSQGRIDRR